MSGHAQQRRASQFCAIGSVAVATFEMASVNANAKMRIIELPLLQLVMAVEASLR
jgi:hypothetical protein